MTPYFTAYILYCANCAQRTAKHNSVAMHNDGLVVSVCVLCLVVRCSTRVSTEFNHPIWGVKTFYLKRFMALVAEFFLENFKLSCLGLGEDGKKKCGAGLLYDIHVEGF